MHIIILISVLVFILIHCSRMFHIITEIVCVCVFVCITGTKYVNLTNECKNICLSCKLFTVVYICSPG